MKKLLLIDGNSMLFRAYYGTRARGPMLSSSGVATNAVYGFSTMLNKALEMMQPTHILIAFDTKDKTFRHNMFDTYKGTRTEVDPDLVSQFELIREFLDAYPMTRYEISGYEADDIIGTMAKTCVDYHVEILTSDKDMLQLIDDHVDVLLMKKGLTEIEKVTVASLKEEMGLRPSQIVDLKAMMGDTADNIPGIPSVGEKTALKYLEAYDTLDGLYENADAIKGKVGERVRENEALARMSYELAKIHTQVPLEFSMDQLIYEIPNDSLNAFYRKYDMNSLVTENFETAELVKEDIERKAFDASWLDNQVVAQLDRDKNDIQGIFLAQDGAIAYLSRMEMLSDANFADLLMKDDLIILEAKKLYHFALENNLKTSDSFHDPLILSFINDASVTTLEKFKDAHSLWNHEYEGQEKLEAMTLSLGKVFKDAYQFALDNELVSVYEDIERPLIKVLAQMEHTGIDVNVDILNDVAEKTQAKMMELQALVFKYAGKEFNLNSPKQLSEVLFDDLEIPSKKKRSTAVDVLEGLADQYPIIAPILEYRKYSKLYSTYAVGLVKFIQEDGKIHTDFNQHAAATGRLSSKDPNLQNISVRDEETRVIRSAFIPSPGNKLVSIDYSQIELRVLSYVANEENMIDTFNHNEDIHAQTAKKIFQVDNVNSDQRRQAKSVNFGIIYGMSSFGLAKQLDISISDAAHFIERYNEVYPRITQYMDQVVADCERDGFVTTLFHRRRYIPEIHSSNRAVKDFGKRAAMNAPIQGTAADIIKLAMIQVQALIEKGNYKSKMLLQVHDELVFDVFPDEIDTLVPAIQNVMEDVVDWPIKMEVSVEISDNWMGQ